MKSFREGALVSIVADGEERDGIVVHARSLVRVEVAVWDAEHGSTFRELHPKHLRERTAEGEHDEALRRQIRRAPGGGGGPRSGAGGAAGRRGHGHTSGHRTTGK